MNDSATGIILGLAEASPAIQRLARPTGATSWCPTADGGAVLYRGVWAPMTEYRGPRYEQVGAISADLLAEVEEREAWRSRAAGLVTEAHSAIGRLWLRVAPDNRLLVTWLEGEADRLGSHLADLERAEQAAEARRLLPQITERAAAPVALLAPTQTQEATHGSA